MADQKHIINRQTIELILPNRNNALLLQNDMSDLVKTALSIQLDHLFSRLTRDDEVLRLKKLEINLGAIHPDKLKDEFVSKTISQVEDQLIKLIQEHSNKPTTNHLRFSDTGNSSLVSIYQSNLDMVIHFLKFGSLPWWKEKESKTTISEMLDSAIKTNPETIKSSLTALLKLEAARKRFIYQFDHPQIIAVLKLLDPENWPYFNQYFEATSILFKRSDEYALTPVKHFEFIFWENAIRISVGSKSDKPNLPKLAKSVIHELLLDHHVDRRKEYIYSLAEALKENAHSVNDQTSRDLRYAICIVAKDMGIDPDKVFEIQTSESVESGSSKSENVVESKLSDLEDENESKLSEDQVKLKHKDSDLLQNRGKESKDPTDLLNTGNSPDKPHIDQKKEDDIPRPTSDLHKKKRDRLEHRDASRKNSSQDIQDPTSDITKNKGSQDASAENFEKREDTVDSPTDRNEYKTEIDKSNDVSGRPSIKNTGDTSFLPKPVFNHPDGEDILINNAGLIILHPFLKYFFEGLGLIENDQFTNANSLHKAVHLLQYTVTQELQNSEEQLVLNKLLCGMPVSEPIPLEVELAKEELEECENLLKAILSQWTVLKTDSPDALRKSFLNREGMLSYGSGWTLKVERTTLDILLDKLPWAISLIKLPWNREILYVEW